MQSPGNIRAAVGKPHRGTLPGMDTPTPHLRGHATPGRTSSRGAARSGARIVTYRCLTHATFRVLWPEAEAPPLRPCPSCSGLCLRTATARSRAA